MTIRHFDETGPLTRTPNPNDLVKIKRDGRWLTGSLPFAVWSDSGASQESATLYKWKDCLDRGWQPSLDEGTIELFVQTKATVEIVKSTPVKEWLEANPTMTKDKYMVKTGVGWIGKYGNQYRRLTVYDSIHYYGVTRYIAEHVPSDSLVIEVKTEISPDAEAAFRDFGFLDALKQNPTNELNRLQAQAYLKRAIPTELDTWEKIEEWAKYGEVVPPGEYCDFPYNMRMVAVEDSLADVPEPRKFEAFRITAKRTVVEAGSVPYTRVKSGTSGLLITDSMMHRIMDGADSMEDVMFNVEQQLVRGVLRGVEASAPEVEMDRIESHRELVTRTQHPQAGVEITPEVKKEIEQSIIEFFPAEAGRLGLIKQTEPATERT